MGAEFYSNGALTFIITSSLLSTSLFIALSPQGLSLSRIIVAALLLLSGISLLQYVFRYSKYHLRYGLYFKIIFLMLLSWSFVTILLSVSTNANDMISLFGHQLMAWAWLTPLGMMIPINNCWRFFCRLIAILLSLGILLSLFSFGLPTATQFGPLEWLYFFPFLLISFQYQSNLYKLIAIISTILFGVMSFYVSQRVNFLYISLVLIFTVIEFYRNKHNSMFKNVFISLILLSTLLAVAFQSGSHISDLLKNDELTTDTRSFIFEELFKDLSFEETITGRGALGRYYSPYFNEWNQEHEGGDSSTRSVAETGYLHIILKGGTIMLILYFLILVPAAYLGIIRSNNIIARVCGYYILLYLLLWCVSYYPVYSPRFLLIWIAAGSCLSCTFRKKQYFELQDPM